MARTQTAPRQYGKKPPNPPKARSEGRRPLSLAENDVKSLPDEAFISPEPPEQDDNPFLTQLEAFNREMRMAREPKETVQGEAPEPEEEEDDEMLVFTEDDILSPAPAAPKKQEVQQEEEQQREGEKQEGQMQEGQNQKKRNPGRRKAKAKKGSRASVVVLTIALVMVVCIAGITGSIYYFQDHAVFGAYLAGENISGKSRAEIEAIAQESYGAIEFSLAYQPESKDAQTVKVSPTMLGADLDMAKTADDVIDEGNSLNPIERLNPFQHKEMNLDFVYDFSKMQAWLDETFSEVITPAKQPVVKYNEKAKGFKASAGKAGEVVSAEVLAAAIDKKGPKPDDARYAVDLTVFTPTVSDAAAKETATDLNKYLKLKLRLKDEDNDTIYNVSGKEIAAWVSLKANGETGKYDVSFDKKKIKAFLDGAASKKINREPVTKKVLVGGDDQELNLIQAGEKGRTISNISALTDGFYEAVTQEKNLDQQVKMAEANYKTERISAVGTNWIEVDLSKQTTTLWNGDTKLKTFLISSGKRNTPTVKGDFRVYLKRSVQTMKGGSKEDGTYYEVANVRWISYFKGGYAFHATYWHSNFGHPMSHGCVNMRTADAKILYDFAPVGTRVLVHD